MGKTAKIATTAIIALVVNGCRSQMVVKTTSDSSEAPRGTFASAPANQTRTPVSAISPVAASPTDQASAPPPEPTNLVLARDSSSAVTASWTSGEGTTDGFVVAFANLNADAAPADCTGGTDVGQATSFQATGLKAQSQYAFRVCARAGDAISAGVTGTVTTKYAYVLVATGSNDIANDAKVFRIPAGAPVGNIASDVWTVGSTADDRPVRGLLAIPGGFLLSVAHGSTSVDSAPLYKTSALGATRQSSDYLARTGWSDPGYYQDISRTTDGYLMLTSTSGHVEFFDHDGAHVYDLALNTDGFRTVELGDGRIASVSWAGVITTASRTGPGVTGWSTPTVLTTLAGNQAFGLDYCAAKDKIYVASNGGAGRTVSACDASSGVCQEIVSDYGPATFAFAIRIDPNADDCAFYLGITSTSAKTDILHYDGDGGGRVVFADNLRSDDVYNHPYAIDFEIEAP